MSSAFCPEVAVTLASLDTARLATKVKLFKKEMSHRHKPAADWPHCAAFSLVELLVVLATVALLAGLLLPTLVRGHARARSTACSSNLRQLGVAFMLNLSENDGAFPTGGTISSAGAQPEDWIWWQLQAGAASQPTMRDPRKSAIASYLGGYDTRFFRCPADRDASARELQWKQNMSRELYTYSYSLNGHSERGMATYVSPDRSVIFRNKISDVAKPSMKIMLAEEKGSPRDGPGTVSIDDGLWQPLGNPLTARHGGNANVTFADGHVETVDRAFADENHPERLDPAH